MDVHTKSQRSFNMSRIRDKNTKPEFIIRKFLWSKGFRYRLHLKDLPGKPDIVFKKLRKAIFINGCFWHKHNCKYFKWPKTNSNFWREKICGNVTRDKNNYEKLKKEQWKYLIIWECEINNNLIKSEKKLLEFLS